MTQRPRRVLLRVTAALVIGAAGGAAVASALIGRNEEARATNDLENAAEIAAAAIDGARGKAGLVRLEESLVEAGYVFFPPGSRATQEIAGSGRATFEGTELLVATGTSARGSFLLGIPVSDIEASGSEIVDVLLPAAGASVLIAWLAAVVMMPSREEGSPAPVGVLEEHRADRESAPGTTAGEESQEQAFMSAIGRELRSSLGVIADQADMLSRGTADKDDAARAIGQHAEHLDRFVSDLSDLSMLEAGSMTIERKPVDLVEVAQALAKRFRPDAGARDIEIATDSAGNNWVLADRERLMQATANLVEHALRASPEGGKVTIATEPGIIRVLDEGAGLEPEDERRAFDRFYLYERSGAGSRDGSGLRLALAKGLTEAMGGSVSAHPRVGEGATFAIKLARYPEDR